MKKIFLICLFSLSVFAIFSQLLEEPKLKNIWTVSGGNLLVIDTWNEIRKSDISYDDVKKLQKELTQTKNELKEAQKEIDKMKKEMENKYNSLSRQIEELKKKK